jgi:N-methylhydantoinase B
VKLVSQGQIVDDVFRLMLAQMRSKRETAGDFRAQVAANVTGIDRLREIIGRLSLEGFNAYIDALISYTSRRTRHEITKLPQGTFSATGSLDNDGFTDQRVQLQVSMTVDETGVVFDTTGSDTQRCAPVNSTYAQTFSACAYALKCLIDQDVPINHGFYERVRLEAPEGTVTNCTPPAPVVGGWETNSRVTDIIFKALAPVLPDSVIAGTKGMMCQVGFGVLTPDEYYCFYEALGGGYGGRATKDGPDAVQAHGQNTENAPIEEIEANYPVRILRYELIPDSGGPGRYRGGLGLRRDYQFPEHDATFTLLADRDHEGPWGLFGGLPGSHASYLRNPDVEATRLNSKSTVALQRGEVISYQTCGGGGYSSALEREPALVLADVRDGKVTVVQAREEYLVIVDSGTRTIDEVATRELRAERSGRVA